MDEDRVGEVVALIEKIKKENPPVRRTAEYFLKHISVGDIRALMDLQKLGVRDPRSAIERLIELGFLERGVDCYNLARPVREYLANRRGYRLL
jgi:hypothetical protein